MEKEFVPYELALRMKQLGFDEPCLAHFYFGDELVIEVKEKHHESDSCCLVPTWQSAFRWFRDKCRISHIWIMDELLDTGEYTYEEAELACLEKLIEIVEEKVVFNCSDEVSDWDATLMDGLDDLDS